MHRAMALLTLALSLYPRASFGASNASLAFWQKAILQLTAVPAEPNWSSSSLSFQGPGFASCRVRFCLPQDSSLPPVLYLLDRDKPEWFHAGSTHAWVALDTRELRKGYAWGDPTRHPMYRIAMIAERSLELLLARTSVTRAGLVGEGSGATAAIALGAMVPDRCRFICAYQPTALPGPAYFDPAQLARVVQTPTLVGVSTHGKTASTETALQTYEQLNCEKELAQLPSTRRGTSSELKVWQDMWHEWANDTINAR